MTRVHAAFPRGGDARGCSRMAGTGGSSRTQGPSVSVLFPAGGGSQGFLPDPSVSGPFRHNVARTRTTPGPWHSVCHRDHGTDFAIDRIRDRDRTDPGACSVVVISP